MVRGICPTLCWHLATWNPHIIINCLLQEGFGLSSSPVLRGQGTGLDVVLSKHVVVDEVIPKQVVQCRPSMWQPRPQGQSMLFAMQPLYNKLCHSVSVQSLLVPPSEFWTCITLSQSRVPSFWSKKRCTSFTNWLFCWSKNSTTKCSGQLDKVAL